MWCVCLLSKASAHPQGLKPTPEPPPKSEMADAPLSPNTEIRTLSRRRNAEKNKKHAKKFFFKKWTLLPKASKKGEIKEGGKGLNTERREKNPKAQLKTKIIQSNQLQKKIQLYISAAKLSNQAGTGECWVVCRAGWGGGRHGEHQSLPYFPSRGGLGGQGLCSSTWAGSPRVCWLREGDQRDGTGKSVAVWCIKDWKPFAPKQLSQEQLVGINGVEHPSSQARGPQHCIKPWTAGGGIINLRGHHSSLRGDPEHWKFTLKSRPPGHEFQE